MTRKISRLHTLYCSCQIYLAWPETKDPSSTHRTLDPSIIFLKILFIYLFREQGREREREGEKYQCVIAPHTSPPGDLARNPGMCPDWESNQQPFGSQARTQSTKPHQPGLDPFIFNTVLYVLGFTVNLFG